MKRHVFIAIGVVALGLGSFLVGARYGERPGNSTSILSAIVEDPLELRSNLLPTTNGEVAALQRQVAQLSSELNSLRNEVSHQPLPVHAGAVARLNSGSGRDPETRREAARERHARMATVEADFLNEPRDPIWSSNMASTIRDAAKTDETMRRSLGNVDCRSKTCRVELAEDAIGIVGQNVAMFLMSLGNAAGSTVTDRVEQANGVKTTILYVSRNGLQSQSLR